MKRLALILAAIAATAAGPLAVDLAQARGRDGGPPAAQGDRGGQRRFEGDRGWPGRQGRAYGPERRGPDRYEPGPDGPGRYGPERYGYGGRGRGPYRGERDDDGRGRGRWERRDDSGPGPRANPDPYPRAPAIRPGGYLPPAYRGALVDDYRRFRLRPPPHGYAWVRVGGGFALVSLDDGQIFDMVR